MSSIQCRRTHIIILFLWILGSAISVYAQKNLLKEWSEPDFTQLLIDSDHISKISLYSQPLDKIVIYTRMEGETFDNSLITIVETESELIIGTDFTPYFRPFNDKLAAHKVLSIEMIIMVPERLSLKIRSRLANVYGTGHFNFLETTLDLGFIELESFEGNAILFSKWGSIKVKALPTVGGDARSVYGKVTNLLPNSGIYQLDVASSHGTIVLLQTKK